MEQNIALEVRFQGETQIYNPSYGTSWQNLMAMLKCSFDAEDIDVYYVDDEDDEIALDTQDEYDEAKKISLRCQRVLSLRIYPKGQGPTLKRQPLKTQTSSESSEGTNRKKGTGVAVPPQRQTSPKTIPVPAQSPPPLPPRPIAPPRLGRALSVPSTQKQPSVTGCVKKAVAELRQMNSSQSALPPAPIKENELIDQIVKGVLEGLDGSGLERARPASWNPASEQWAMRNPPGSSPQPIPKVTRPKTRTQSAGPKLEHTGVVCCSCQSTIIGTRYKCGHCLEFDLCEECEALPSVHDPNHVFLKLKRPAFRVGMKSDGRMAPILKHPVYADDDSPIWDYKIKKMEEKMARKAARAELKRKYREEKRRAKMECPGQVSPMKRERIEKMAEKQAEMIMTAASIEVMPPTTRIKPAETTPLLVQKFDASFVRDGNLPDETHMQPKTKFLKSWIMCNTGNVKWNSDTKLKHLWGDIKTLGSDAMEIPLLAPGEEGPICVDFEAPKEPGRYQSHWRLMHKGDQFGHRVWCIIIVDRAEVLEPTCEKLRTLQEEMTLPKIQENGPIVTDTNENTASSAVAHLQTDHSDSDTPSRVVSSSDVLTAQDVLSFEMLNINDDRDADKEVEGVNSPATMATPNNTPIVGLTPCISPVPQLDEKLLSRRVSEHSDLEIIDREDVPDIIETHGIIETHSTVRDGPTSVIVHDGVAVAEQISEHDEDLESMCSSSDSSDILEEYCVVPLPDCFDPTKPIDKSMILSTTSLSSSTTSSRSVVAQPLGRLPSYEESQAEVERGTSSQNPPAPAGLKEGGPSDTVSMAEEPSGGCAAGTSTPPEAVEGDESAAAGCSSESGANVVDSLLSTANPALETVPLIPLRTATPPQQLSTTTTQTPKVASPPQQTVTMAPMPEITLLATPTMVPPTSEGGVLINPEGSVLYEVPVQPETVSKTRTAAGTREGTNLDTVESAPQIQETSSDIVVEEQQQRDRQDEHEEFHDAQDTPSVGQPDESNSNDFQTDPVELLGYTAARAVEVAGNVVRHAFDSAASSVNALLRTQSVPTPALYQPSSPSPMDQLIEMGFGNRAKNLELLEKHNDNVSLCVQDLLQTEDNEWMANRH